jgi:hypothetical protein
LPNLGKDPRYQLLELRWGEGLLLLLVELQKESPAQVCLDLSVDGVGDLSEAVLDDRVLDSHGWLGSRWLVGTPGSIIVPGVAAPEGSLGAFLPGHRLVVVLADLNLLGSRGEVMVDHFRGGRQRLLLSTLFQLEEDATCPDQTLFDRGLIATSHRDGVITVDGQGDLVMDLRHIAQSYHHYNNKSIPKYYK